MEFDPNGQLAHSRAEQPLLDAAYVRADGEKERYLAPVIEYFGRLEAEIVGMPIATRFSSVHGPNFDSDREANMVSATSGSLTEAEYKRGQLLADLNSLRGRAMSLIGGVESLVMDMQATKQD